MGQVAEWQGRHALVRLGVYGTVGRGKVRNGRRGTEGKAGCGMDRWVGAWNGEEHQ